jgi:hypothetical protein
MTLFTVWSVKLKFEDIQIRVRTACDESKLQSRATTNATQQDIAKKDLYEKTGMCEKGKRYEMYVDANGYNFEKQKYKSTEEIFKHTVLNWGIYSEKGDTNYLIPIKIQKSEDSEDIDNTVNSNIHTYAINSANSAFPLYTTSKGDFVVMDGDTKGQIGYENNIIRTIAQVLNQSLYKPADKADLAKPQISNPRLRLTVEQKFLDAETKYSPNEPKYIPYLEYQILYKVSPADPNITLSEPQISGIPTIIGEGYSGGFKHTIKAYIYETPTGFDYVYQKT